MKTKTLYLCNICSHESPKWLGQCPQCKGWNSFSEQEAQRNLLSKTPRSSQIKAKTVSKISLESKKSTRFLSNISEFDRVLGGGIFPGSLILLSGEPGIGKSTLTIQIANQFAKEKKVLLISGEESVEQISNRAHRLKLQGENLFLINEFNLETIIETIKVEKPDFAIIDSIQVISSLDIAATAGSITQVRYCTEALMELAKTKNIPIILIGHVTKDGNLAGPKVLEHLVDTVLQLEGDRFHQFRLLKSIKNRFGSCNETGIFEMQSEGMIEVKNPSEQFLSGRKNDAIGSVITATMEGSRPLLVEVQALVSTSVFGYPKRTANGFDLNRLQILIAVLEKYAKINLQNQDVFVNIVGGIKLSEPSGDLAVLMAIASSFLKTPLNKTAAVFAEVGLSGELRKISHLEKRIQEAEKMGFKEIIDPVKFKDILGALSKLRTS